MSRAGKPLSKARTPGLWTSLESEGILGASNLSADQGHPGPSGAFRLMASVIRAKEIRGEATEKDLEIDYLHKGRFPARQSWKHSLFSQCEFNMKLRELNACLVNCPGEFQN